MTETGLTFGPEWLRVLSHGGSGTGTVSSPPSSPGPMKFKLAEYRYGREEMLSLFMKELPPPDEIPNLGTLLVIQTQEPLAFIPINPEEQRMWYHPPGNEPVPRGTGRSAMNGVGRGRGGGVDRGHGRGRSVAAPYYSRGISYEEEQETRGPRENGPPGMRPKGYERSQSTGDARCGWTGERAPTERNNVGADERGGDVSPRKDQGRAATNNWRSRNEKESNRWKGLANPREKWGNRIGWRERENGGGEGEWEEGRVNRNNRSAWEEKNESYRRNHWDEDNLPEWATEESEDKGGCFDAAGAFSYENAPGSSDEDDMKELPPENESHTPKTQNKSHINNERIDWNTDSKETLNSKVNNIPEIYNKMENESDSLRQNSPLVNGLVSDDGRNSSSSQSPSVIKDFGVSFVAQLPLSQIAKPYEDDKLEHMQIVADDLVAKLIEDDEPNGVDDSGLQLHKPPPPGGFLPADSMQPAKEHWFYTDPQGDVQGPFSSSDMAAWCKAGYFKPDLLLRRDCDDKFAQLGDLTRVFGRVPFLPGPPVPPLKVSELLNAQKAQAERERLELLQAYQKQQAIQQSSLRQQVLQQLQSLSEWSSLSSAQQQQLFMQQMVALQPQASSSSPSLSGPSQPHVVSSDPRLSSAPVSTPLQQQDPIQAFVAQMATTQQSSSINSEPPNSSTGSVGSGSPLEKLLCQLKKSQNPTSSTPPVVPGPPSNTMPNSKPEQFDAIKSLMNQLNKRNGPDKADEIRYQDEDLNRIDDEKKIFDELKRAEEERIKLQEMRLHEERIIEDARRKELEAKNQRLEEELKRMQDEQHIRRQEEQQRRQEDQLRRIQEDQQRNRQDDQQRNRQDDQQRNRQEDQQRSRQEDSKKKMEENKKFMDHHQKNLEAQSRKEEEHKRQKSKQEEEKRQLEDKRKKQEEKKKAEEDRRKEEEKKRKEEKERLQQMRVQEEMRRIGLEEERRRMQLIEEEERRKQEEIRKIEDRKQKVALQERMKQTPPAWSKQQSSKESSSAPSLAEIQKAQELKEKKEREAEAVRETQRQKEAQRQAADEKKLKEQNIKWASRVNPSTKIGTKNSQQPQVKSLKEIQKEEEKELKKRVEKELAERATAISQLSLNAAGVWGSTSQSLSWANRASTGAPPNNSQGSQVWASQPNNSGVWSSAAENSAYDMSNWNQGMQQQQPPQSATAAAAGGFWESPDTNKSVPAKATNPSVNRTTPKGGNKTATQAVNTNNKANKKKSKDETDVVKKIFTNNISPVDTFAQWCRTSLNSMKIHTPIDVPTFVGFMADVESPYDVHDYIRSYLGDSKEVKEFARQYLERRSKARNAHKERLEEDNILAPAPAINPVASLEFQEVKNRLKKGKKKMQRIDNSILGFNMGLDGDDSS